MTEGLSPQQMACFCSFDRQIPVRSNLAEMRLLRRSLSIHRSLDVGFSHITLSDVDQAMVVADMRRTCDTLAGLTFNSRAVSRTPRPSSSAARTRFILTTMDKGTKLLTPPVRRHVVQT